MQDLPVGYYLDNFQYLKTFVCEHYADILSPEEAQFCSTFDALSHAAQQLYVRLVIRKGPYFRTDKLRYDEIEDIPVTLKELASANLVHNDLEDEIEAWLHLATKPELATSFEISSRTARKDQIAEEVIDNYSPRDIARGLPFELVEPRATEIVQVLKLLFFGNLHQDFTEFVLRDLGISPFESYPLDAEARYFNDRSLVETLLEAYLLRDASEVVMASEELSLVEFASEYLSNLSHSDPWIQRRYSKTLNRVARQLERESEPELAIELYRQSVLAPSREREARLLATGENPEASLLVCKQIFEMPLTEAELDFAVSFGNRTAKKFKLQPDWLPSQTRLDYCLNEINIDFVPDSRVEFTTRDWYQSLGHEAYYVENSLVPGVFGLYFWDIIFAPIRGAFFNPLQRGPSDLFSEQFYQNRKALIESRFALMSAAHLRSTCEGVYATKKGIANHFVDWRYLSPELLDIALTRIPVAHWQAMFRRLLRDLRSNRSGLPDLVVFPESGDFEFIEIKGPGDTLQDNQKRWLRFFQSESIPASVVNVTWRS